MARSFRFKAAMAGGVMAVVAAVAVAGTAERDRLADLLGQQPATDPVPTHAAQPVRVTPVVLTAPQPTASFTGTVRPRHETALGFRLGGKMLTRHVEVGDRVTAGQIIAQMDDTDVGLQLEAAQADVNAANTDLSRAEAELERSRVLFSKGHIAQAALDRTTSAAAEAQTRLDRAKRTEALAANQLTYTTLRAETDGVVTATTAEAGQVVAAGQPVVSVAQMDNLDVVFALPEQQRALLDAATANAELWDAGGASYALTLRDVSPDVDPAGRTYRVRMAITTPDEAVTLGRTVSVRLSAPDEAPVATLPLGAVVSDGHGPSVWRLTRGREHVERVDVTIVALEDGVALVRGDLSDGDVVVSLGAQKIDPAQAVRVVETAATPTM